MLEIRTRPAHPNDVDFLSGVFLTSMRDWITVARGYWDLEKESAQFRQQLEVDNTRVIQVANQDVGFVMSRQVSVGTTEVHTLCVANGHQNAGIGTLVMRDLMHQATVSGSNLELSVLKSNTRAQAFYARLGFAQVGESPHHVHLRWPEPT